MITITKDRARQFLLRKHGLIGGYKFAGKQGVLDFIRQAGCVQYDPVDVCGRKTKTLTVKNIRYESGVRQTKKLQKTINGCLSRFARFNGCEDVRYSGFGRGVVFYNAPA